MKLNERRRSLVLKHEAIGLSEQERSELRALYVMFSVYAKTQSSPFQKLLEMGGTN